MIQKYNSRIKIIDNTISSSDYPKEIYTFLSEIESKHGWFWAKNKSIEQAIKKYGGNINGKSFLEVGCGTGYVLAFLEKMGLKVTGIDIYKQGLEIAQNRTRKAKLICADIRKYKDREKYDFVGLFDLIEHLDSELQIIKKAGSFLKKGGLLFLTVPARMSLFSYVDVLSGHKKRFERGQLLTMLQKADLEVVEIRYLHFFLYPVSYLYNKIMTGKYKDCRDNMRVFRDYFQSHIIFNHIYKIAYYLERTLGKYLSFPFGTSLIAVGRKK